MDAKKKFVIKPFKPNAKISATEAVEKWASLSASITQIYNKNASTLSFEELYRSAYNLVLHKHGEVVYNGVKESITERMKFVGAEVGAIEGWEEYCGKSGDDDGTTGGTDKTISEPHTHYTTTNDSKKDGGELLGALEEKWKDHKLTLVMVRDILMYLDRTYVVQSQPKKKPVYYLGLSLFRTCVWDSPRISPRAKAILLDNVRRERMGMIIDRSVMKGITEMMVEIGDEGSNSNSNGNSNSNNSSAPSPSSPYVKDFQRPFFIETRDFYRRESQEFLEKNTVAEYVRHAHSRLSEEEMRVRNYLSKTTESELISIVEEELVTRHASEIVNLSSGVVNMLEDDRVDDLRSMYDLFCRVKGTEEVLFECVSKHVNKVGRALVTDQDKAKEPVNFVKGVLSLRDKYDQINEKSFKGDKKAMKKLKEAFEGFINHDTRAANYLTVYVDQLLRSGLKGVTEQEADTHINKIITVFRYLQDKDIFEDFYRRALGKRLLQNKSLSDELEKMFVAKLKAECGYQFTSKLEGMFNDMRISKDTMSSFKANRRGAFSPVQGGATPNSQSATPNSRCAAPNTPGASPGAGPKPIDIDVDVLTTGYWPTQNDPTCQLPDSIESAISNFEAFYFKKHTGRKLAWKTCEGSCEMKATFGGGRRHDLIVSTYQMCILMLFNESETITLSDIRSKTNIPEAELRRHLISLCTSRHKILKKKSKGKAITEDDSFTLNNDYTSNMKRVKIPLVSMKETEKTGDGGKDSNVSKALEEARKLSVEASIVRIMKSRKSLNHNALVAECNKQVLQRFSPTPQFIKQRIESLIEREYLERSEDDPKMYLYLA